PNQPLPDAPDVIVILGGAGMPSADGLQRTHFGAIASNAYPNAEVVIALPAGTDSVNPYEQLKLMAKELVTKGVDPNNIKFESKGFNTHSQAAILYANYHNDWNPAILVVTSPEHMFRAVKSFEKVGFTSVGGLPTFEVPVDGRKLKGQLELDKVEMENITLRYNMWSYLQYEIRVLREYMAITYYWLLGWI
ncbi:MAG: YdcF family protein, partial [Flavobacteriales bacterium]